ncbi:MAG: hypothetical protein HN350_15685 [Phycisphaerales bacterium]|nr:hypothetical protein [Phycisphaerales bacterium]
MKFGHRNLILISIALSLCSYAAADRAQISIKRVEAMPDFPEPYVMRDWDKVAADFDALLFDTRKKGPHLPLIRFAGRPGAAGKEIFYIPSYVGHRSGAAEGITCFGAVSGALIAGVDKSNQNGRNYLRLVENYYHDKPGLYLNNLGGKTGKSFWYEIFPSVLFYRIYNFAPDSAPMRKQFFTTADNWYDACVGMGGRKSPRALPDFNHTAFSFETMKPVDNKKWTEPDSSAGVAWIEYMAHVKSGAGDKKYLTAAKWAMDYLQQSKRSPFYEVLMPLGAYTAARMNAELGTTYDTQRFVNWCFSGESRRRWGATVGKWGDYDCAGLVGSVRDEKNMYAFAMNSFDLAASIVPIVRYDDRFADAIGKWMLNLANSSRLFYPNALPEGQQADYDWSRKHDPNACIAYEGLRQRHAVIDRVRGVHKTVSGSVVSGSIKSLAGTDRAYQCLEEGPADRLEHIWTVSLSRAEQHHIHLVGKTSGADRESFAFSYSDKPSGPFKPLFTLAAKDNRKRIGEIKSSAATVYLKVVDSGAKGGKGKDRIYIDDIWIVSKSSKAPFATGDARKAGWGKTNLGLYGSGYVGILAGIVNKTNVKGVLQLDCLATDFHHAPAYPTYLYYNPYDAGKKVEIDMGKGRKDIYLPIENKFSARGVSGKVGVMIAPKSSRVIILCPTGGKVTRNGRKTLVNGVVVDYR